MAPENVALEITPRSDPLTLGTEEEKLCTINRESTKHQFIRLCYGAEVYLSTNLSHPCINKIGHKKTVKITCLKATAYT